MTRIASAFTALAVASTFWVAPAEAAAVYRCGSVYADQPCDAAAVARPLALLDTAPSRADEARARAVADRDQRRVDAIERDRLVAQARERPALAGSLGPSGKPTPAPAAPHRARKKAKGTMRVVDGSDFTARAPSGPKATRKAVAEGAPLKPPAAATPR